MSRWTRPGRWRDVVGSYRRYPRADAEVHAAGKRPQARRGEVGLTKVPDCVTAPTVGSRFCTSDQIGREGGATGSRRHRSWASGVVIALPRTPLSNAFACGREGI